MSRRPTSPCVFWAIVAVGLWGWGAGCRASIAPSLDKTPSPVASDPISPADPIAEPATTPREAPSTARPVEARVGPRVVRAHVERDESLRSLPFDSRMVSHVRPVVFTVPDGRTTHVPHVVGGQVAQPIVGWEGGVSTQDTLITFDHPGPVQLGLVLGPALVATTPIDTTSDTTTIVLTAVALSAVLVDVEVWVTRTEDATPIPRAEVRAGCDAGVVRSGWTDDRGHAWLRRIPPGQMSVTVAAHGFARVDLREVPVHAGASLRAALPRPVSVSGRLILDRDSDGWWGAAEETVFKLHDAEHLSHPDSYVLGCDCPRIRPDATGRFEIPDLAPGIYAIGPEGESPPEPVANPSIRRRLWVRVDARSGSVKDVEADMRGPR